MGERLQAIDVALNNELREHEFYKKQADRTKNPLGKAMFKQIGEEELEHHERLKELNEKWKKDEKWPETLPLKVEKTVIKDILVDVLKGVEKQPESDADDLEAVRTAIEFEYKGVDFYKKLENMVSDPKEKRFFSLLAGIEHDHALSLQEAEEFLTDPESYYRRVEHHSMDGG